MEIDLNCPKCGSQANTPINIETTFFECVACRNRFHIHGVNNVDVDYILDESSAMAADLTYSIKHFRPDEA